MRPYLAVIKDSFREAISSRVLPLLLVIFTIALLVIAPFGLREKTVWQIQSRDIFDAELFLSRLRTQQQSPEASPGRQIVGRMSPEFRAAWNLESADAPSKVSNAPALPVELNRVLRQPGLYDETAWRGIEIPEEAERLLATGPEKLSGENLARLNRLLLDAAYPNNIAKAPDESVSLSYLGIESSFSRFFGGDSLKKSDVQLQMNRWLSLFCTWFVGVFGVLVAILVTANIVPRTFEPGSIDLLLSKPISRSAMFLTKFFSGCAFILITTAYFLIGLWLIAGTRLEIWNANLLLCIPVFLFVFAVVYSLSAFSGVVWRNPIISVMFTVLCWGFLFALGFAKSALDYIWNGSAIAVIVPAGEDLLATDKNGQAYRWNEAAQSWETILEGTSPESAILGLFYPMIGPVYDPHGGRIAAIYSPATAQGFGGGGQLILGARSEDWELLRGPPTPTSTNNIFVDPEGRVIVAGPSGVYALEGSPTAGNRPFKLFGIDLAKNQGPARFIPLFTGESGAWGVPFSAAMDPRNGKLVIFERGKIHLLRRTEMGAYEEERSEDLQIKEPGVISLAGQTVVLATESGTVRILSPQLKVQQEFTPYSGEQAKSVTASANGRWFAVLFHHKRLWLFDADRNSEADIAVSGQGDITASTFDGQNHLLVADRWNRVTSYDPEKGSAVRVYAPNLTKMDVAFRYGVTPLYSILPKPGELSIIVNYLFTGQKTEVLSDRVHDLRGERIVTNFRRPIVSNLIFLAVILAGTCFYISRKDF